MMHEDPAPKYENNTSLDMRDKDGNLIGEILWEDEQGNPAFVFRGQYDISFEALNRQTGEIASVMSTSTSDGNVPTLFAPYRMQCQHIIGFHMDADTFRLGNGFNLSGDSSGFIIEKRGVQYLRIGSDLGGLFLQTEAVYERTSSSNPNVVITENDKTLRRSTSAKKYKEDIQPIDVDPLKILELTPVSWVDKAELAEGNYQRRYHGLIADEVDAVGLGDYVTYENDEVDALMYDRLWTLLIPVIKDLKQENEQLRKDLENTNKVASDALIRVEKLEEQMNENTK